MTSQIACMQTTAVLIQQVDNQYCTHHLTTPGHHNYSMQLQVDWAARTIALTAPKAASDQIMTAYEASQSASKTKFCSRMDFGRGSMTCANFKQMCHFKPGLAPCRDLQLPE